jgi:hypothetical protein
MTPMSEKNPSSSVRAAPIQELEDQFGDYVQYNDDLCQLINFSAYLVIAQNLQLGDYIQSKMIQYNDYYVQSIYH